MNKLDIQKRVLKYGKPLSLDKFSWCEDTKTFSSKESNLVLDFNDIDSITFKTGSYCTFKTGSYCIFNTPYNCTFNTGSYCTFKTSYSCTFKTGSNCTFNTAWACTFNTIYNCTFNTGSYCVLLRRDVFEIIELKEDQTLKLRALFLLFLVVYSMILLTI